MKLNAVVVVAVLAAGARNKILDTVQADIDKAKSDPNAISDKSFADGNALAQQYGLKVCGK